MSGYNLQEILGCIQKGSEIDIGQFKYCLSS